MSIISVVPRPESYCTEWVALKFNAAEGVTPAKLLLKGSPWALHIVVGDSADPYLILVDGLGGPQTVHHNDWIVKSPHGKFWFLDDEEFNLQFTTETC